MSRNISETIMGSQTALKWFSKIALSCQAYAGSPTSSDISVAIALPISWYDLALPFGPSKMNKNLQMEQCV